MDDKVETSIKLGLKRDDTNDFFVSERLDRRGFRLNIDSIIVNN